MSAVREFNVKRIKKKKKRGEGYKRKKNPQKYTFCIFVNFFFYVNQNIFI